MKGENIEFRCMTADDVARVVEIARSLRDAPHWPEAAYISALNPESTPRRITLIASERGEVVGFAVASLLPPQAELETIAVVAASQRLGLGSRLFAVLAGDLRAANVKELLLEVRASNQVARSFYHSLGFEETGRRTGYYADPAEDAVLMQLEIE